MPAKKKVVVEKKVEPKKAVKGAALSPAELKAFQQRGFNKPKGFKSGR